MLYNFDIGSGDKSPQNVNNFNDACNSDTFLAGCVLEGGVNCSISPVPVPGLGVFLRDSSYGIWDYLKKLCFWELETKNRVTSLFEAYLKVPQVSRDYMCYICIS